MESFREIFDMPLFPHLYAIPLSMITGVFIGYVLRGKIDEPEIHKPQKPKVD